jgi:hypothetical protein
VCYPGNKHIHFLFRVSCCFIPTPVPPLLLFRLFFISPKSTPTPRGLPRMKIGGRNPVIVQRRRSFLISGLQENTVNRWRLSAMINYLAFNFQMVRNAIYPEIPEIDNISFV